METQRYDDKQGHYFSDSRREMLPFISPNAKTLLELGCGDGAFAATLKLSMNVSITAIEGHAAAAECARPRVDRIIVSDIGSGLEALRPERFDCIVANDVLEHLVDPWAVLRMLKHMLTGQGTVVVSLPNVRYMPVFKDYVMHGNWQYQRDGVMDKTHLRFFTEKSIQSLFADSGFVVSRIQGINAEAFTWKFRILNALMGGSIGDTRFKQFAVVVRPS